MTFVTLGDKTLLHKKLLLGTCSKCGLSLPPESFFTSNKYYCKSCIASDTKKYRSTERGKQLNNTRRLTPKYREQGKKYLQTGKGKASIARYVYKRKQLSKFAISTLTQTEWKELKEQYNQCCAYCCKHTDRLTMDHIIPISKGGTHTKENIVPACKSCNSSKGDGPVKLSTLLL